MPSSIISLQIWKLWMCRHNLSTIWIHRRMANYRLLWKAANQRESTGTAKMAQTASSAKQATEKEKWTSTKHSAQPSRQSQRPTPQKYSSWNVSFTSKLQLTTNQRWTRFPCRLNKRREKKLQVHPSWDWTRKPWTTIPAPEPKPRRSMMHTIQVVPTPHTASDWENRRTMLRSMMSCKLRGTRISSTSRSRIRRKEWWRQFLRRKGDKSSPKVVKIRTQCKPTLKGTSTCPTQMRREYRAKKTQIWQKRQISVLLMLNHFQTTSRNICRHEI